MTHTNADEIGVMVPCPSCSRANRIAYGLRCDRVRCGQCKPDLTPVTPLAIVARSQPRSPMHVALITVLGIALGCSPSNPPETVPVPKSIPVRVALVTSEGRTATEDVVGTVRARLHSSIEAKVAGRIQLLPVVPGQLVKKGDTVAVLDGREIRARLDSAQAVLEQATRDFTRTSKLTKEGAATAVEEDAMQARQRIAAANVMESETLLEHTRVLAPFDGVITRKLADVGDLAAPGRALVEIEDPVHLRFEADLPEALVDGIQLGAKLWIRLSSSADRISGVVSEIAPVAESASRTYQVKFDLPPSPLIRAGQFGRVAIPTGETKVPQIPTSAVVQRGQLEYVFVVISGKSQLRLIRSGKRFENFVEVVSGLNPGEKVVAEKTDKLRDGQPVEVLP